MQARAGQTAKATSGAAEISFSLALREPALFVLAAILLFAYSLFPRGYIPARTANGVTIVLCSAAGLETRPLGPNGSDRPRRHIGSVTCDIAGGPAAAVLASPLKFRGRPAALVPAPLWPVSRGHLAFRSHFDPNAPPTAPPLLTV